MATRSWLTLARPGTTRMLPEALCRVLMALSGLVVLQLDPPDFAVAPEATAPMLLAYLAFATWLLSREWHGRTPPHRTGWFDLGWCLAITAVTGGTSSVLFFFLLLPILSRSFRDGFAAGWTMTLVTTVGFLLVGLPTSPGGILFEFNRAMIRPLTLLILGYMIAREGGVQKRAQRQLSLLTQINTISNPRFGADRTLLNAASRIRESYGVHECLIVLRRDEGEDCLLARSSAVRFGVETLPAAAAAPLLALPDRALVLHSPRASLCVGASNQALAEQCEGLGDILDTTAFVTVPMSRAGRTRGRLFLMDARLPQFDAPELQFLAEAGVHLLHIVEKVDLLDRLASLAANRERRRMANDLHDMAIQPYLGLQLGLEAALRRQDNPAGVVDDLRGLLQLTHQCADELRRMLAGEPAASGADDNILSESLLRLSRQYQDHFGIEVVYECEPGMRVSDRLAADLLAMISEGLSNIRRHTASRWARLQLHRDGEDIRLTLANESRPGGDGRFVPKSIHERARRLGGDSWVDHADAGVTRVQVHIPL